MTHTHILAGDIGGTKTHLALYRLAGPARTLRREATFASRDHARFDDLVAAFLGGESLDAAAFGIAGPVVDGEVRTTNLPWHIAARELAVRLDCPRVALLNDLGATALGALHLPPEQLRPLQAGVARPGHIAVIAAGTGLGQAYLHWDGQRHLPAATEGGHTDFAPANERDVELWRWARTQYGHVSWERLVSGPGLHALFRFIDEVERVPVDRNVRAGLLAGEDPGRTIGEAGLAGSCPASRHALDWFVRLYGAQAGNLALTVMALGGVMVGGGIVVRLLPAIDSAAFRAAFCAKGRYQKLLEDVPIHAILEPKTALFGAVEAAIRLLQAP